MLETDRIQLHPFRRHHLEQTRAWVNTPELARFLGREKSVTPEEHERWYQEVVCNPNHLFFSLIHPHKQQHIGNVWLWNIEKRHAKAEVRILIGSAMHQNKGLGSQALCLISNYAFEKCHLHKLYAYVFDFNERAYRAFKKAKFEIEGVLKQDRCIDDKFVDVYLFGRIHC